jgi:hypothetical protein
MDNTLGCASGEKICMGPTAMIQVLPLWAGLMQSTISRSLRGMKKLEDFYLKLDGVHLILGIMYIGRGLSDFGEAYVKNIAAECV